MLTLKLQFFQTYIYIYIYIYIHIPDQDIYVYKKVITDDATKLFN